MSSDAMASANDTKEDARPVIELTSISKVYFSYASARDRLIEVVTNGQKRNMRERRALDDISFKLSRGDRLGIVGENGSGKSTLLKILAGVLTPTSGHLRVDGRIAALLELGAGFNPELTGIENIRQFCMLHGMYADEAEAAIPEILAFSELRDAISQPVKVYSSGMAVRLAFASAVYVRPDILIVDEALSVGDAYFQNKCLQKIRAMLDQGTTFIYVTHAPDTIRSLCNKGIWLENGRVRLDGAAKEVGAAYQSDVFRRMVRAGFECEAPTDVPEDKSSSTRRAPSTSSRTDEARVKAFSERVAPFRTGSGEVLIDDIVVINEAGAETDAVQLREEINVRVFYHVVRPVEGATLSLGVTDATGKQVVHFNSGLKGDFLSQAPTGQPRMLEFRFRNVLCPGEFGLIAGIAHLSRHPAEPWRTLIDSVVDSCVGGARFRVDADGDYQNVDLWGLVDVDFEVSEIVVD